VLSDAGLVAVRVDAQRRIYELRPEPLRELDVWIERYRRVWEANYQRLDVLLDDLLEKKTKSRKERRPRRRKRPAQQG
jgi:DNA-binding transcriptional ArsR family regulator